LWDAIRLRLPVNKAWNPKHAGATWIEEMRTAMLEIPKECETPAAQADTFAVVHLFLAEKWPMPAVPQQWFVPKRNGSQDIEETREVIVEYDNSHHVLLHSI